MPGPKPPPAGKVRSQAVRDAIYALLDRCTETQRAKLDETYELVRRTVIKNEGAAG